MVSEDTRVNLTEETLEESVSVPGKALLNQGALSSLPVHRRHMSKPSQCQSAWSRMAEHRSKPIENLAGLETFFFLKLLRFRVFCYVAGAS